MRINRLVSHPTKPLGTLVFSSEKGPVLRTLKSFLIVAAGCAALAAFVPACSSSDSGGGSSGPTNTFTGMGDATAGKTVFSGTATCSQCHGPDASGGLGPNITFSTTAGIGDYTEQDLFIAVRTGKNKEGEQLCVEMAPLPATTVSDKDIGDIYAYLQTTKNDTANKGSYFTGNLDKNCDH